MSRPERPGQSSRADSDTPEFVQRGKVLVVQRQFQEAVRICRIGLLAEPTCVEGRLVLGMALMALGRFEEVLGEMRAALELDQQNAMTHLLCGEALLRRGQDVPAHDALSKARELDPRNEKILRLLAETEARISNVDGGTKQPTDTKLYPAASKKLESGETDVGEHEISLPASQGEEEEDERFTTAPWLPPKRPRTMVERSSDEDTEVDDGRRGVPSALVPLTREQWTDADFSPLDEDREEDEPTVGDKIVPVASGAQSLDFEPSAAGHGLGVDFDAEPTMPDMAPDISDLMGRQSDDATAEMVSAVDLWPEESAEVSAASAESTGESGIFDGRFATPRTEATAEFSDVLDDASDQQQAPADLDELLGPIGAESSAPSSPFAGDLQEPALASSPFDQVPDAPRMLREDQPSELTYDLPLSALELLPDEELSRERALETASSLSGDAEQAGGLTPAPYDEEPVDEAWAEAAERDPSAPLYLDDVSRGQEVPEPETPYPQQEDDSFAPYEPAPPQVVPAPGGWDADEPPLHLQDSGAQEMPLDDAPESLASIVEPLESGPAPLHLDGALPGFEEDSPPMHLPQEVSEAPPVALASDAPLYLDGAGDVAPSPLGDELGAPQETHLPEGDPSEWGWSSEDGSFPPSIAVPSALDSAEVGVEVPESGPRRTAAMEDDGRFVPFVESSGGGTGETMAGGPRGYQSAVREQRRPRPFDDDPIEDSFISEARDRRRRAPMPVERTTWVTLVLGESGRQRWVRAAIAVCIVLLALGGGFLFRSLRIGHQVERKVEEARGLLDRGNVRDYQQAAQRFADVIRGRKEDGVAKSRMARVNAAIPFEFGDANPAALRDMPKTPKGGPAVAALTIYRFLAAGKLRAALRSVSDARSQYKENALIRYLSGRIYLLEGRAEPASRELAKAVELNPRDCQAMAWLGLVNLKLEKPEEAAKWLERSLRHNPSHVTSHLGRAKMLLAKRRLAEADVLLNEVATGKHAKYASRGQRGWALALRAKVKALENKVGPARAFVEKARVSAPTGDPAFYDLLADVLIDLFQLGSAEKMAKQSEKVMGHRPHPRIAQARIFLLQGRAQAAWRASSTLESEASALLNARIQLELGKITDARRSIEGVLQRTKSVEAELTMARVLAAEGKLQEAQSGLSALLSAHPKDGRVLTALGVLFLEQRSYDRAKDYFSRAAKHDHTALGAKLGLADVYLARGDYEKAHQTLNEEHRTHPWFVPISKKLAWLDIGGMNLSDAKSNLQRVLKAVPGDMEAQLMLVEVLTLQRNFGAASSALEKARGGAAPAVALAEGRLALVREEARPAISKLELACERGKDPSALVLLARAYGFESKGGGASFARFRAAFGKLPEWHQAHGILALAQGRPRGASTEFKKADSLLRESPRSPRAVAMLYIDWAQALQDDGRAQEALRKVQLAKTRCKACYFVHYREGLVRDEQERSAEAIAALRKAVELAPTFRDSYYWLGKIYADQEDRKKAREAYQSYLRLNPPAAEAKEVREALRDLGR